MDQSLLDQLCSDDLKRITQENLLCQLKEDEKLTKLCKNNHRWQGIGLTLRTMRGRKWECLACRKTRHEKNYYENLEKTRQKARERMRNKRKNMTAEQKAQASESVQRHYKKAGRKSRAKGMEDFVMPPHLVGSGVTALDLLPFKEAQWDLSRISPEIVISSAKVWHAIKNMQPSSTVLELVTSELKNVWNAEKIAFIEQGGTEEKWEKEKRRQYYHWKMANDPNYVLYMRQKSKRRKAQMRDSVAIQIAGKQIRARFAEFDHRCAYCGADGDLHIEHVVPISRGGTHAIGNIVPACKDCNYSKFNHDAKAWYQEQPFYSELRWRKICRVLGWSNSSAGQLALL